ncbi:hypothetical protein [Streptobacillus moniliformis]|uniref:hypothetical protein n=1 Tax=Streptobacillus moniliformis TaxID=34105 RepID=UPI0007E47303|nr:hypothetical protein [Streptobacillus moniliformis]
MKKKFLILSVIFSIFSFSNKKLNIVYKAGIKNEGNFSKIETSKIEYVPLNLTVSSLNNEFKANLIIKGERKNLNYSDLVTRHETVSKEKPRINMKNGYMMYQPYYDKRTPDYGLFERALFKYDNQDTHDDHHHHHHHHDHDHDHDHNHDHNDLLGESLDIQAPQKKRNIRESNDFQSKLSLEMNKKKYGLKYIKYLTSFNEEKSRYLKNDSIFEGRITQIINDNIAITLMPRLITREFTPAILEANSYLKYRLNKDTFIGIDVYNGGQINLLDERKVHRNKVTAYFDYNTERRRVHDFWEILDHEHEKIDQFKVSLSYDRKYNAKYSPLDSAILDGYNDNEKYDFKLNLKKSDFGIKGLSLSNDFTFNTEFNQRVNSDRKYKLKHFYYLNSNSSDVGKNFNAIFDMRRNVIVNTAFQKTLDTSIHKLNNKYIIVNHYMYSPNGKNPFEYYVVTEAVSDGPNTFSNVITKKYNIDNVSKVEYVKGRNKVNAVNKIKYFNDVFSGNSKLNDDLTLSYERGLKAGYRVKFNLENKYERNDFNNKNLYETNILNSGMDFNYLYNQNGLNIKTGLTLNAALLARKADKSMLLGPNIPENIKKELSQNTGYLTQEADEANKWKLGEEFKIKQYISIKYSYNRKVDIKANLEVEKKYDRSPFAKLYFKYNPANRKIRSYPVEYKLAMEFSYKY